MEQLSSQKMHQRNSYKY